MEAVTLRGPYRGTSGYDSMVRAFARELLARQTPLQLVDIPRWSPCRLRRRHRDAALRPLWRPVASRTVVQFCMPHQLKAFRGVANVDFTMFEADRIPARWARESARPNLIVVPTPSSRNAWVASGCPETKLRVCPLGVDPATFRPDAPRLPLPDARGRPVASYRVRVLNVSDVAPRKNLASLYRCWLKATDPDDDAVLVLKLNCGSRAWLARFMDGMAQAQRDSGRTQEDAAPVVWLVNRRLADEDMPRLFAAATHYWSMSCGEGWDLPMIQSAATGLELLAPAHSAYLTYLDDTLAHCIPVHVRPAESQWSNRIGDLFAGANWWVPDENAAMDLLRATVTGGSPPRGPAARERVSRDFTWTRATDRLIECVDEADSMAPAGRRPTLRLLIEALRPL
jgi:glycosyltransferase involved in cell wall biosynthesis